LPTELSAGFTYGLIAAIAFAFADPGAAFLSRRMGPLPTTLLVAVAGLPLVALATVLYSQPLAASPSATALVIVLGIGSSVSYVGLYYAFAVGPLAVVGPITATFGTVTVVFAVVFLGERLTLPQTAAVIIATAGSLLASIEIRGVARIGIAGYGPPAALGAVVLGSAITVLLQHPIRANGWVPTVIAERTGVAFAAGLALLLARKWSWPGMAALGLPGHPGRLSKRFLALIGCVGVFDAIAFSSFAIGLSAAPAWLVALVAATSPIVLMIAGLVVLHERLRPVQWVGVGCVFCSMAVIAVG
jgi:drug/metabolite transporter (DMT)-like permease